MGSCFLCGVGGSGMSALADILIARGWAVSGSDRSRDRGETPEKFRQMEARGVKLFPQDGSGVEPGLAMLVVSSAVEDTIPDVRAAKQHGVEIRKRADVLAELFNRAGLSIGIGGTSGKSTVTAMTGWILAYAGLDPTVINGAGMTGFGNLNARVGNPDLIVAELDESDGSIALFRPSVAVLTNMTLDHKPLPELRALFGGYVNGAAKAVINLDDAETCALFPDSPFVTFALDSPDARFQARNIRALDDGVEFTAVDDGQEASVRLRVPGRHNVANALAAMAASSCAGVSIEESASALAEYKGIKRRFEIVGSANGVTVIDDFAHNPDKIAATLRTLHERPGRILAVFQPHGFGPTRLTRRELVDTLAAGLHQDDMLVMPEIYYAGGTATRDISSADIAADVAARSRNALFVPVRADIPAVLAKEAKPGDRIIVMGARDDTLTDLARAALLALG